MSETPKTGRFVKRMIDSHAVLGLTFAALIYVVSVTGALIVFAPEIALWENRHAPAAHDLSPELLETAFANTLTKAEAGNERTQIGLFLPTQFQPVLVARLNQVPAKGAELKQQNWVIDPDTGALLGTLDTPLTDYIEALHTALHLPAPWGRYLVGLLGVCMFTLILSGIFAHPTIVKDAFKLRLESNTRMAWTDVHNRLSVWGLPFHLVLTFTGAFLGLAGVVIAAVAFVAYDGDTDAAVKAISGPDVKQEGALETPPPIASMLQATQKPGRTPQFLFSNEPQWAGGITTVNYVEDGILSSRSGTFFYNDGAYAQTLGGKDGSGGMRALGLIQPLHYGTFGGYAIKMIYLALALALTYITSSGMMIWFRRKAQQGTTVHKTKAAWHGMTTGLSLSLAAGAAVSAVSLPVPLAPICLGIWLVAGLVMACSGEAGNARWFAYFIMSAVLVSVAAQDLISLLLRQSDHRAIILSIDALMLVGACCLSLIALKGRRTGEATATKAVT